jgi:hypothetical protein
MKRRCPGYLCAKASLFLLALCMWGCAAGLVSLPAAEDVSSLAGTVGTTATGYFSTWSTANLNEANLQLVKLQAAALRTQAREMERKRRLEIKERAVTVGILRDWASARHDPTLSDLAMWVEAGGDSQFAMKYLLDHQPTTIESDQPCDRDGKLKRS